MSMLRQVLRGTAPIAVLAALLAGCSKAPPDPGTKVSESQTEASMTQRQGVASVASAIATTYARHFSLRQAEGYQVLEMQAPLTSAAGHTKTTQRFLAVLVPRGAALPSLPPMLRGAVIVRTPVERIAVSTGADERMLTELGMAERLVAVGGTKSYDDAVRGRVLRKELAQVGYSWHSPPNLDVLVASKPDVFLLRLWSLELANSLARANGLGVPTLPVLLDAENSYLGRAEWIKVFGALTGTLPLATQRFEAVAREAQRLKALAANRPAVTVVWAYLSGANRWTATVRGAEAAFVRDANGINVFAQPEDATQNDYRQLSTETLLSQATDASCWLAGDIHARQLPDEKILSSFRAWREGCFFGNFGRSKPQWDAFDYYETGVVRPDLVLRDFVKMLHPGLVAEPFDFLLPIPRGASGSKPR